MYFFDLGKAIDGYCKECIFKNCHSVIHSHRYVMIHYYLNLKINILLVKIGKIMRKEVRSSWSNASRTLSKNLVMKKNQTQTWGSTIPRVWEIHALLAKYEVYQGFSFNNHFKIYAINALLK